MEKWQKRFVSDARYALDHFTIIRYNDGAEAQFIEAEADTGSKYVMYSTPSLYPNNGDFLVVIRQPWTAVYEQGPGLYTTPGYFVEKFRSARGINIDQYHGGDVYALLQCLSVLIGSTFPQPEELFL